MFSIKLMMVIGFMFMYNKIEPVEPIGAWLMQLEAQE